MKNLKNAISTTILIIALTLSLSITLFSCGSNSGNSNNPNEYKIGSERHLEVIFYSLYDNFNYRKLEDTDNFLIMPDDNLTGDDSDFVATLKYKLIEAGFLEEAVNLIYVNIGIKQNAVMVVTTSGFLYHCYFLGISKIVF